MTTVEQGIALNALRKLRPAYSRAVDHWNWLRPLGIPMGEANLPEETAFAAINALREMNRLKELIEKNEKIVRGK